jgi:hypothetical protein
VKVMVDVPDSARNIQWMKQFRGRKGGHSTFSGLTPASDRSFNSDGRTQTLFRSPASTHGDRSFGLSPRFFGYYCQRPALAPTKCRLKNSIAFGHDSAAAWGR